MAVKRRLIVRKCSPESNVVACCQSSFCEGKERSYTTAPAIPRMRDTPSSQLSPGAKAGR
jgi:hypothetical protein